MDMMDKSIATELLVNNNKLNRLEIPSVTISQVNSNEQTSTVVSSNIQSAIPIPIPYNEPLMVPIISKLEDNVNLNPTGIEFTSMADIYFSIIS